MVIELKVKKQNHILCSSNFGTDNKITTRSADKIIMKYSVFTGGEYQYLVEVSRLNNSCHNRTSTTWCMPADQSNYTSHFRMLLFCPTVLKKVHSNIWQIAITSGFYQFCRIPTCLVVCHCLIQLPRVSWSFGKLFCVIFTIFLPGKHFAEYIM